jgi:transposase-like protein
MKSRRKFSREFKQTAIRQMAGGKSAAQVAALEVHPGDLYRWRRELEAAGIFRRPWS